MGKVKKESDFFAKQMDELKRRTKKGLKTDQELLDKRSDYYSSRQRKTREPEKASTAKAAPGVDSNLLNSIFSWHLTIIPTTFPNQRDLCERKFPIKKDS